MGARRSAHDVLRTETAGTTTSGLNDLVTGRLSGSAGRGSRYRRRHYVSPVASHRSPASGTITLTFRYSWLTVRTLLERRLRAFRIVGLHHDGVSKSWAPQQRRWSLGDSHRQSDGLRGQDDSDLIEATDASSASLVSRVDDLKSSLNPRASVGPIACAGPYFPSLLNAVGGWLLEVHR